MAEDKPNATLRAQNPNLTPSNIITVIRILLVPIFVTCLLAPWPEWLNLSIIDNQIKSFIAAGIFILVSATDWLDGYLARKRNEVTDFGKFVDPLADKILVLSAFLVLVELGALPSWTVIIIIAREFVVSGLRMIAATQGRVIHASPLGKCKTVFQMITVVLFTIKLPNPPASLSQALGDPFFLLSWFCMIVALGLTIASMVDYLSKSRELLGFKASKSRVKNENNQNDCPTDKDGLANDRQCCDLAAELLRICSAHSLRLGTVESATGGLIAAALTDIAGSSEVFKGTIVSYDIAIKEKLADVSSATIQTWGVVSEQVALEMAKGGRAQLEVDICCSVTGIAGPTGAEPSKPVGCMCIACATPKSSTTTQYVFEGNRQEIREQCVKETLIFAIERISQEYK